MHRVLARLALPLLLVAAGAGPAPAEDGDPYVPGQLEGPSDQPRGQACWPYLRSPIRPPADTMCAKCAGKQNCGAKDRPKGTSGACWGSQDEACFWKRHAWSWGLACSQCWADEECGDCDELIGGRDPKVLAALKQQVEIEGGSGGKPIWIVVSPHFYVVTDIHRRLKVPTEGGAPRVYEGHEVAHLYAQRCELAYRDFMHYFGGRVQLGNPMGVYLFEKTRDKEDAAEKYLGGRRTDMLYGGGSSRIAGGYCGNGFVTSLQEERSDTNLHANCRHMIGHILLSCWIRVSPHEKELPKWMFIGAAHFMEKLLPEHWDYATFCSNETAAPSGSPKDWDRKARALARRNIDPIETFFGRESLGAFGYEDHIRAWSIMDLMLREDNARWLKTLEQIRFGAPEGAAFKEGLGLTPDAFNERWLERLSGGRPTMGEIRRDASEAEDEPGARERKRILETTDEDVLAGLIRGLDHIDDVKTAKAVVSRFDHDSDLVRETIHVVLLTTKDAKVLEWMSTEALDDTEPLVRAGVARVLGALKHKAAREKIESLLEDRQWLVRAEAAWALGQIGDEASLPRLIRNLDDRNPKAWMLTADAVSSFGRPDEDASAALVQQLGDRNWQVRVTACRALARVGTEKAIGPLIERFNREGGRLYRELRTALKSITQDDLGPNPETWQKWWDKQQEQFGGLGPMPEKRPEPDSRYGNQDPPGKDDPTYYGRRIYSKSVGFVLDTSGSMETLIKVSPAKAAELGGLRDQGTRFQIAKDVLCAALEKLDPRVQFSLVFFSSDVRPWKKRLIPATPGNVNSAVGAVGAANADGETNIHGALKAALGLHEKGSLEADLDPIPDTVYFLTDGAPTRGQITDTEALLSWFENLNRFAKVDLHVIAMGNLGVDIPFLQRLAKAGGGDFIHVPEGQ